MPASSSTAVPTPPPRYHRAIRLQVLRHGVTSDPRRAAERLGDSYTDLATMVQLGTALPYSEALAREGSK